MSEDNIPAHGHTEEQIANVMAGVARAVLEYFDGCESCSLQFMESMFVYALHDTLEGDVAEMLNVLEMMKGHVHDTFGKRPDGEALH